MLGPSDRNVVKLAVIEDVTLPQHRRARTSLNLATFPRISRNNTSIMGNGTKLKNSKNQKTETQRKATVSPVSVEQPSTLELWLREALPHLPQQFQAFIQTLNSVEREWVADALMDDYPHTVDELKNLVASARILRSGTLSPAYSESATEANIQTADTSMEAEQNVTFSDEVQETQLIVGQFVVDDVVKYGSQQNAYLGDFLSRPIQIYTREWTVGAVSHFLDVINPWELFLDDSLVKNKLQTFKLLHGTLKIKFLVNGSPFHYGRVFVGVRPSRYDNNMSTEDPTDLVTTDNYRTERGTPGDKSVRAGISLYSSRPHIFVDPQTNQPQRIDWPFFAATNWLDLTNPETIDRMGRLEIWELNTLRHANGAIDPITIKAYAWMEDVELTGLTSYAPAVSQSAVGGSTSKQMLRNTTGSEYGKGAISQPASIVANYAAYFTQVPLIGKYAKATQMASGAIGDIARLFGFSRPAQLEDVSLMRPTMNSSIATTVGGDATNKLTLDPKQELTVDPSTVGLSPDDQMSLGYLSKKEGWIDTFSWEQADATEAILWHVKVHPMVAPVEEVDTGVFRHWQTPLTFATVPFTYWSGSLRYRFQIVASKFHRGRIAIQYDPSGNAATPSGFNTVYTHIVDITETRDFTLEVKWSQPQAYAKVRGIANPVAVTGGVGTIGADYTTNGVLTVSVLNILAGPVDEANIEVNVFISSGDDYELKVPDEEFLNLTYTRLDETIGPPATTQSYTEAENDPEQSAMTVINGSYCPCDPTKGMVYFGESCVSARSLMKRYNYHRNLNRMQGTFTVGGSYIFSFRLFNFPVGPGRTYGGSVASDITSATAFNVVNMTYIRYFAQGYIGWRGSLRYKGLYRSDRASTGFLQVSRMSDKASAEASSTHVVRVPGSTTNIVTQRSTLQVNTAVRNTVAGAAMTTTMVNPTLEFELPFYSPYRYCEVNEPVIGSTYANLYQSNYIGGTHWLSLTDTVSSTTLTGNWIEMYVATGEDFSFFFFIGGSPYYTPTDILTAAP